MVRVAVVGQSKNHMDQQEREEEERSPVVHQTGTELEAQAARSQGVEWTPLGQERMRAEGLEPTW